VWNCGAHPASQRDDDAAETGVTLSIIVALDLSHVVLGLQGGQKLHDIEQGAGQMVEVSGGQARGIVQQVSGPGRQLERIVQQKFLRIGQVFHYKTPFSCDVARRAKNRPRLH